MFEEIAAFRGEAARRMQELYDEPIKARAHPTAHP